ncbi:MAG: chromosomal replication initiator protein DnaA [Planctomycetota bacterium]|nr:chromosomal replication initiator protein DnaA [Planctomycetota bacterium]
MTHPDRQIWEGMLSHLRSHHAQVCRQWFEELEPLGIVNGTLQLRTMSPLHRDYLRRQCADSFNDAARTVTGHLLSVKFLGPDDEVQRQIPTRRPRLDQPLRAPDPAPEVPAGARPGPAGGQDVPPEAAPIGPGPAPTDAQADPLSAPAFVPPAEPGGALGRGGMADDPASGGTPAPHTPAGDGTGPEQAGAAQYIELRPAPSAPTPRYRASSAAPARYESLVINPDYSFENFVPGPSNRLGHAASLAVAANPGRTYNPLFLHGGVGLGKTHLLQAICLKIVEASPRAALYYTSCEGFVTQFMECVQSGEMAEFRHRFRDVDVLVIDDIHFLTKRDRSQEEFFHTFNSLFQASKQIILSSDAPPEEIPDLEERLVSRFKWGLVCKVDPPCYETRVEIVKAKARLRGMPMPEAVAGYIAQRLDSNIRELEGAVVKLQIQSVVEKRPIDLELARLALGDPSQPSVGEPTIQHIINVVTDYFSIRLADLQSKQRHRSIALPRQVCMYLARRSTRHSLEEIGGFFGGRDHTTVMHAIRAVEAKCREQPEFETILRSLETRARGPFSDPG